MSQVQSNFLTKKKSGLFWLLWLMALIGISDVSVQQYDLKKIILKNTEKIAQLNQAQSPVFTPKTVISTDAETVNTHQITQQILRELSAPWIAVLNQVQSQAGQRITLHKIEPDAIQGQWQIEGRAISADDFLNYLTRLQKSHALLWANPVNEEPLADGTLNFHLLIAWRAHE